MRTLNRKLFRDLWSLRAQTLTTGILIACGVALLVASWSAYQSLETARDTYYRDYNFADVFAELKNGSTQSLRQISDLPGVQGVVSRVSADGLVTIATSREPAVGRFLSIPSGTQPRLNRLHIRTGRLPMDATETEIVVHEGFAQAHRIEIGNHFEIIVRGQSERVRVVGVGLSPEYVYALSSAAPLPDDLHFGVFWMTEKSLQRLLKVADGFNSLLVKVDTMTSIPHVTAEMDRILKPYGSLGAYGRDRQISSLFLQDEISQQRVTSIIVPAIFLAIATFLINIVASRLVSLQRAQIAALKALGYSRVEVSIHYLKLICIISVIGTLPGLGLGAWLGNWMSETYESYFRFPSLDFSMSLGATVIGGLAGILPGLLGAGASIRSVFDLAPAEAMRHVAPPAFHASVIEALGLNRLLTTSGRMTFRNLFLRPVRLLFVIVSMSSAIAIVITAGSWTDMVEYLISTQFQRLQREDLSITLLRPRGTNVLQEVLQIPGVISVEGFRVVPIRIRFANHKREISLTGWPESSQMRQRLNAQLDVIPLPPSGLLLSRFFQKSWGMKIGDTVHLELLDGTYSVVEVPVAGFTDELVGLGASMQIESLWKLMKEEPTYNSIAMKADPRHLSELYVEMVSRPEIGAVNLKQSLYRGFRDSFGQVIRNSTLVLMIASLLISMGIIYNAVRVSFSERSWELASLRVLGFDRLKVAKVLLAEVGAQVGFSLLPGCFLGWLLTHLSLRLIHTETFAFPVIIAPSTYARGLLVVLFAFVASGWIVYRMVGRLNPAEALKERD